MPNLTQVSPTDIPPLPSTSAAILARELVDKYEIYLYRFASRKISDLELVKDLVQDTLLAALESYSRFEGRSSLQTWLTAILRNKIHRTYLKNANSLIVYVDNLEEPEPVSFQVSYIYTSFRRFYDDRDPVEYKELMRLIADSLKVAPESWRLIFIMKYIDGLDKQVICGKFHISEANYWLICHRVRQYLQKVLAAHWPE